jgi:predicted aldo/keto reductase-like oxidoreductase
MPAQRSRRHSRFRGGCSARPSSRFHGSFDSRIKVALDYGVNYIDTARTYAGGRSEPHAANTLHKLKARQNSWITSKTGNWDAKSFARDVGVSLQEMKTNYIDLYYLHELDDPRSG